MAANGISTLTIPTGITATSYTQASSYLVAVGTFNYDAYGAGFAIRKDGGTLDAYMTQVLALGPSATREYTSRTFTYGEAQISFTLNADGTFSNVTCPYGAGGYHATGAQLTMLGTQTGGATPANDIVWNYVCANGDGVITSFTYASGTPSGPRNWTFVPGNGQPSFTRLMKQPDGSNESNDPGESGVDIWNITTDAGNLSGAGEGQINIALIPNGTAFVIYATELGTGGLADKEARQKAKLEQASLDRARQGNPRHHYDITQLPTQYSGNGIIDNPNLAVGDPGIRKVTYTGYHDEDVAFTDTATAIASTTANNFVIASIAENTTVLYTGYLLATYTGTWTLTITSDDGSYLWIGSTAVSGYTTGNELASASYAGPGTGTISLTAGEYYPIRLLYGNGPSGGSLNLTYAHTGQTATNDFTGKLFSPGVSLVQGRPWLTQPSGIASLFAAGEKGVWYDPSDITTLFQDVAGTIPVTATGQSVALMRDKSGNNAHATQSDAAKRPTYYNYPGTEYSALHFDGTNDFMVTDSLNFTGTNKVTATTGFHLIPAGTGSSRIMVEFGTGASNGGFYITAKNNMRDHSIGARGTASLYVTFPNNDPQHDVITGLYDLSQSDRTLGLIPRMNGYLSTSLNYVGTDTGSTASMFGNLPLYIGARAGTTFFFTGNFYGAVIRGAESTQPEITLAETWTASKLY